jgi:hypothetical protein
VRFMMLMIPQVQDTPEKWTPSAEAVAEMGRYNASLDEAGILLALDGLHDSSKGARIAFSTDGEIRVTDGPFTEAKELIAGCWLWQVKSMDEAIEWVKRCPNPTGVESEIEIRQLFEAEDFGTEYTPELREQEKRLLAQVAAKS